MTESIPLDNSTAESNRRLIKIGSQRDDIDVTSSSTENSTTEPARAGQENVGDAASDVAAAIPTHRTDLGAAGFDASDTPEIATPFVAPRMQEVTAPVKISIPRDDDLADDWQSQMGVADAEMSRLLLGDPTSRSVELTPETRVPATVVKLYRDLVFFVLPGRQEGVCSARQFSEPPPVGTRMDVIIVGSSPDDGLYELSVPGASVDVGDWSDLAEGVIVEARVTGHNAGGLECEVNQIRGFIPASQASLFRVENFSEYVGQKLVCVVTEANHVRRNLVLSHRAILERQRAEKRQSLLDSLAVGDTRDGVITNVKDFGAFVDVGGVEGLIHVSQLSWERIKHPSDVVENGQRVRVRIEKIDPQTGKISLSYRELLESPWQNADAQFPIGAVVPGTVTRIMEFGAFVRVGPGMEGLVHISELAHQRVRRVDQVVREGQEIQVKILSIDREAQRISLSIKGAQNAASVDLESESESTDDSVPTDQPPRVVHEGLKGGVDRRSGGSNFGLKW